MALWEIGCVVVGRRVSSPAAVNEAKGKEIMKTKVNKRCLLTAQLAFYMITRIIVGYLAAPPDEPLGFWNKAQRNDISQSYDKDPRRFGSGFSRVRTSIARRSIYRLAYTFFTISEWATAQVSNFMKDGDTSWQRAMRGRVMYKVIISHRFLMV